jgi:hypothetical protein
MAGSKKRTGGGLFIVDNSDDDCKVAEYLKEWCEISERSDRATVEKHVKDGCLKQIQAPVGVKPVLKRWMELV